MGILCMWWEQKWNVTFASCSKLHCLYYTGLYYFLTVVFCLLLLNYLYFLLRICKRFTCDCATMNPQESGLYQLGAKIRKVAVLSLYWWNHSKYTLVCVFWICISLAEHLPHHLARNTLMVLHLTCCKDITTLVLMSAALASLLTCNFFYA